MIEPDNLLGKLLLKKGYITTSQLMMGLDFQTNLDKKNWVPLGEILIRYKYITREKLNEVLEEQKKLTEKRLNEPFYQPLPQRISTATNRPMSNESKDKTSEPAKIQPHQFKITSLGKNTFSNEVQKVKEEIKKTQQFDSKPDTSSPPAVPSLIQKDRESRKPLGEILVEKGLITRYQLSTALQYQAILPPTHYKPIGEVMIDMGLINREQLQEALTQQPKKEGNTIGEILKKLGFINEQQLSAVLSQQHSVGGKHVLIGELLVQHGFISKENLEEALKIQKSIDNKVI
ncbi:MAG: hypothetical protein AABZ74_03465 [Cyanobacteriota bacterium]